MFDSRRPLPWQGSTSTVSSQPVAGSEPRAAQPRQEQRKRLGSGDLRGQLRSPARTPNLRAPRPGFNAMGPTSTVVLSGRRRAGVMLASRSPPRLHELGREVASAVESCGDAERHGRAAAQVFPANWCAPSATCVVPHRGVRIPVGSPLNYAIPLHFLSAVVSVSPASPRAWSSEAMASLGAADERCVYVASSPAAGARQAP